MPSYNNPLLTAHALTKRRLSGQNTCHRCGKSHEWGKCPVYGKTCDKCKGSNLFKLLTHQTKEPWHSNDTCFFLAAWLCYSSTVRVPPRRQPRHDTSTRNRRKLKLDVTDPDLLIPIKQTWVTTRHSSDLREPQPSPIDSHPASLQPVSETITSESSVSLPSSPSGSSRAESISTSGTDSSTTDTYPESSLQPSSNTSSPDYNISQFFKDNVTWTARDGALFQHPAHRYQR